MPGITLHFLFSCTTFRLAVDRLQTRTCLAAPPTGAIKQLKYNRVTTDANAPSRPINIHKNFVTLLRQVEGKNHIVTNKVVPLAARTTRLREYSTKMLRTEVWGPRRGKNHRAQSTYLNHSVHSTHPSKGDWVVERAEWDMGFQSGMKCFNKRNESNVEGMSVHPRFTSRKCEYSM